MQVCSHNPFSPLNPKGFGMVFFEKNQKFSKHGKKIEVDLLEDSFCEKTE